MMHFCHTLNIIKIMATSTNTPRQVERDTLRCLDWTNFDVMLACLLNTRLRGVRRQQPDLNLHFELNNNFNRKQPYCDLTLNLGWCDTSSNRQLTYFVYLLHSECKIEEVCKVYQQLYLVMQDSCSHRGTESFLGDSAFEDSRFILVCSSDMLQVKTLEYFSDTPNTSFPFVEMFHSDIGKMFYFSQRSKNIFCDLDRKDTTFRKEFIRRLSIFSLQASCFELNSLLEDSLMEDLGVPLPNIQRTIEYYVASMKHTWHKHSGIALSENSTNILEAISENILNNENYMCLKFNESDCKVVRGAINNYNYICISVKGISRELRCSKIIQVFKQNTENCFQPSMHYTVISECSFDQYPRLVLESLCTDFCDILVINLDRAFHQIISFINTVLHSVNKVIVISEDFIPIIQNMLRKSGRRQYSEIKDNWTLSELTESVQKKLVKQRVVFQGSEVLLSQLEASWPSLRNNIEGTTLNALVKGDVIVFGSHLPITCMEHYIPRKLQHETIIKPDLFDLRSANDFFVLTGFSSNHLQDLRTKRTFWEECRLLEPESDKEENLVERKRGSKYLRGSHKKDHNKTKWSVWECRTLPKLFYNVVRKNLHWVEYKENSIVWKFTNGDAQILENYIDKQTIGCQNKCICIHCDEELLRWNKSTILISGEAGVGKTTCMTQIAKKLKDAQPFQWVIFVPISQQNLLQEIPTNVSVDDVVYLLELCVRNEDTHENCITRRFIKECLTTSGGIAVFVDGVDELEVQQKSVALRILDVMKRTLVKPLIIASRSSESLQLSDVLKCQQLTLLPFSRKEQHCYVLSNMARDICRNETKSFKNRVENLLHSFQKATEGCFNLCEIPLYLKCILQIYKTSDFLPFLQKSISDQKHKINLMFLYSKYVQEACECTSTFLKNGSLPYQVPDVYELINKLEIHAAKLLFEEKNVTQQLKFFPTVVSDILKFCEYGIARLIIRNVKGRPQFQHHTFKEYFAAAWCKKNYKSYPRALKYINASHCSSLRYFFDAMLVEDKTLHQYALHGNSEMMTAALQAGFNPNTKDGGGRTPLHLAASYGHSDIISLLLAAEAKVSVSDSIFHWTPLQFADVSLQLTSAEQLLRAGAKPREIKMILKEFSNGSITLDKLIQNDLVHLIQVILRRSDFIFPHYGYEEKQLNQFFEIAVLTDAFNVSKKLINWEDINVKNDVGLTHLHITAFSGNYKLTQLLLNHGASVEDFDSFGETALHKAVRCGHVAICKALLMFGADPNMPDASGKTPVFSSLKNNRSKDLLRLLLKYNASLDIRTTKGATVLIAAAREGKTELCKFLLVNEVDVNACDIVGTTSLHVASEKGFEHICRLLLQKGANVNMHDEAGQTALLRALNSDHPRNNQICKLLIKSGAEINVKDSNNVTPIQLSIRKKNVCIYQMLLTKEPNIKTRDSENRTLLHEAVVARSTIVSDLLARGVEVNSKDIHGNTALHLTTKLGYEEICFLLFQRGSDVNLINNNGKSAFHLSAAAGHLWICRLLLEHGAILNLKDSTGKTPLHYAAVGGHGTVCRLLLEQGADPNVRDNYKKTPVFYAVKGQEVVCRMLLDCGADVNVRDESGKTVLHYAVKYGKESICNNLLMCRANVNACDFLKRSVLLSAVSNNQTDVCSFLLNRGAHVHLKDSRGMSALLTAAKACNEEMCRLVLENGGDIYDTDNYGRTPLHFAAKGGNINLCKLLLQYRSEINVLDCQNVTALDAADCDSVREFLKRYGGKSGKEEIKNTRKLIEFTWCCKPS